MSRILPAKQGDTDTFIGYDFPTKVFYVINKDTRTERVDINNALTVLKVVQPDTTVTLADLEDLRDNPENLQNLYFTWSDKGDYIATIQINDYATNPICINMEVKKIYIMNTPVVFDLTLNEPPEYRVDYLTSYFSKYLGMGQMDGDTDVFKNQITLIYNLLMSYYSPTLYNEIDEESLAQAIAYRDRDDVAVSLKYGKKFGLTNYNGTSVSSYICTVNPNSEYTPVAVAGIGVIQANTNLVGLAGPVPSNLKVGSRIIITGTAQAETITGNPNIGGETYTDDGKYTISKIDVENEAIVTKEPLATNYLYPYPQVYTWDSLISISSTDATYNTITLTAAIPNTIKQGDTIHIVNTTRTVQGSNKKISIDGAYTVTYLDTTNNTIGVRESIKYNTNSTLTPKAIVYKRYLISAVSDVVRGDGFAVVNLTETLDSILPANTNVLYLDKGGIKWIHAMTNPSTVSSMILQDYEDPNAGLIALPAFTPIYPVLYLDKEVDVIEVNVLEEAEDFPVGKFNVDNTEQCTNYINTCENLIVPNEDIYDNIGEELSSSIEVEGLGTLVSMGTYTLVYEDNK